MTVVSRAVAVTEMVAVMIVEVEWEGHTTFWSEVDTILERLGYGGPQGRAILHRVAYIKISVFSEGRHAVSAENWC